MVRRMADAGASAEAIAIAVEEVSSVESALSSRRAADRDRKRRQREARETANVTGHSGDIPHNVTPFPVPPSPPPKRPPNPLETPPPISPQPMVDVGRARSENPFPRPDGVDPQHWRDFLANRKRKRLSNTLTAHKRLLDDLARLSDDEWPPGRLIEHAAAKGWGGIYDPREKESRNGMAGSTRSADGLSATTRAANRVFGAAAPRFGEAGPR